jgi:hypothetical protein
MSGAGKCTMLVKLFIENLRQSNGKLLLILMATLPTRLRNCSQKPDVRLHLVKTRTRFTNLLAEPDASGEAVTETLNDSPEGHRGEGAAFLPRIKKPTI